MSRPRLFFAAFLAVSVGLLAACGGGGGGSADDPVTDPPIDDTDDTTPPADNTLSDAELQASFNEVAEQTAFDVEREMGFHTVEAFNCDADGVIDVQGEGKRRFCIVVKDEAERAGAPAVSPDGLDFYLELPPVTQADFETVLTRLQSGQYDGEALPFTPVLAERIEREAEIGSLVDLTFTVAQAGYGSCDVNNAADEPVTSIDSLSRSGDQLSGTLPANLSAGSYQADCEFTNNDGTYPGGSSEAEGVPAAASIEITSTTGSKPDITTFYFEPESAVLSTEARATLMDYATYLENNPGVDVRLEGHADDGEKDSREENMVLGENRANAVRDFLIINGVGRSRVQAVSYGEERPVEEGDSESEKALNRRVEIFM
ncbi:MAG: OmpA family protein [Pseudomonadota bacterium]